MASYFTLSMDTTNPTVTVSNISRTSLSDQTGADSMTFDFTTDESFIEYKVMKVSSNTDEQDAGTNVQIATTNGSINMTGTGTFAASTAITCTINVADFSTAVSDTDGDYIIKVFVKDDSNNWST